MPEKQITGQEIKALLPETTKTEFHAYNEEEKMAYIKGLKKGFWRGIQFCKAGKGN